MLSCCVLPNFPFRHFRLKLLNLRWEANQEAKCFLNFFDALVQSKDHFIWKDRRGLRRHVVIVPRDWSQKYPSFRWSALAKFESREMSSIVFSWSRLIGCIFVQPFVPSIIVEQWLDTNRAIREPKMCRYTLHNPEKLKVFTCWRFHFIGTLK